MDNACLQLVYARSRRSSAEARGRNAEQRVQAARRRVEESRMLLERRELAANVIRFPLGSPTPMPGRHADEATHAEPDPLLREILWEHGAETARMLVESMLASVPSSDASELARIRGLRAWLARQPR